MGWARDNLFSNYYNAFLTVVSAAAIGAALWWGLKWVLVDADWTVISTLGGFLAIGEYNTEKACEGQNCFWRPQVSLMLVMVLAGMAWGIGPGRDREEHRHPGRRSAGRICISAVQLRADGDGRPAADGGEHPGGRGGVGAGQAYQAGHGARGGVLGCRRFRDYPGPASRAAGDTGPRARFGDLLGRDDVKPAPGGCGHSAQLANRDCAGARAAVAFAGSEGVCAWRSSRFSGGCRS